MRKSLNLAELDVFINECVSCVPRCFCKIKEVSNNKYHRMCKRKMGGVLKDRIK
jgi:hypothetical protein